MADMGSSGRERDLVLAPNQYAFILDETKGYVVVYVGPHKTSLANTDRPVAYSEKTRRYERVNLEQAIQEFLLAPEGWYIVLENPCKEGQDEHPRPGSSNPPKLEIGRKINTPGPISFPLWPGQVGQVIEGHHLRSNQYLVVRVYNEDEAKRNWAKSIMKPQRAPSSQKDDSAKEKSQEGEGAKPQDTAVVTPSEEAPDLTMGKLFVIQGTDVSFYIPPTGIEVVSDPAGKYVRNAVTLERLEYCILLDEDGEKRYVRGPDMVFPRPTESFIEKNNSRKFKAIELNEISGIYVKVIAPYTDDTDKEREVGEELFITGREQMIYFPRPEHAIIKYGEDERHYAVAIPAGEGRYVLNRLTGEITTKVGPCTFLPDPRKEVIVRRILDSRFVQLLYPRNQEALAYNTELLKLAKERVPGKLPLKASQEVEPKYSALMAEERSTESFVPDDFVRKQTYTPARTITLDTKYDGVISVNIWTGYAVLLVAKTGKREVVLGPKTLLLDYDQMLEAMTLSSGTPKSDDAVIETVYLRVLNNKVSDVVSAETRDLCGVSVRLSYRVNFEGDSNRWFNVENYVKFLTDHLRSLIRNAVKQHGIEEFYGNAISIIRDTVLGVAGEHGKRPGRVFEENGMRVYDVEVLDVKIGDSTIAGLLTQAQHSAVQQAIKTAQEERTLEVTRRSEEIKRHIAQAQAETLQNSLALEIQKAQKTLELELERLNSELKIKRKRIDDELSDQENLSKIHGAELLRERESEVQKLELSKQGLEQELSRMKAEVEAVAEKAKAFTPDLIAALQAFGDRELAARVAQSMSPLAILGGTSVAEVFSRLLKGTAFENLLGKNNGSAASYAEVTELPTIKR